MYESIGGNKRIGGTFCSKLINEESQISAYRWDFFSFSNKRPVRLFGTLEYLQGTRHGGLYLLEMKTCDRAAQHDLHNFVMQKWFWKACLCNTQQ